MPPKIKITRRELIKQFGMVAFMLHPVLRSMNYALASPTERAPRFVMFFKGGALIPRTNNPSSLSNLEGTALAPLQNLSSEIILFKNMHTHGGSPKSNGHQEEHGAGLYGCVTGDIVKYTGQDAYYAYTDHESIDIRIANYYKTLPELSHLAFSSLHLGAGAHSDADDVGLGNKYISFRNRAPGDTTYGNAVTPIQSAEQVYKTIIGKVNALCAPGSNRPVSDSNTLREGLARKKSVMDFILGDIERAKRAFGMDSEHAHKLDGMAEGWREAEKSALANNRGDHPTGSSGQRPCITMQTPTGNGTNKLNMDELSPVHDQMIGLIKIAFEWDLTRVLAYTASGASCGQFMPSKGIHDSRHSNEHAGNEGAMLKLDTVYVEKFAKLLSALKSIDDGNGKSALYNTTAILGMECWSSNGHYLTNIPYILAGQGGGKFNTGRIVDAQGRSNNDLLLSCLKASGVQTNTFGLASLCKGPIV